MLRKGQRDRMLRITKRDRRKNVKEFDKEIERRKLVIRQRDRKRIARDNNTKI